jgi:tetratricopeptide (TPR) repeat protein
MRLLGTAIVAVVALWFLSPHSVYAATERLTYEKYMSLPVKDKEKIVAGYVKKVGNYHEVAIDSYLVRSDISPEDALAYAVKMDEFYRRFTAIFIGPFRINVRPELYILKSKNSYSIAVAQFIGQSPPSWSAGLFAQFGNKYALFGCAEWGEDQVNSTLRHEGTHQLMCFYMGCEFPRWFDEGIATNLEEWDVGLSAERNIYEEMFKSHFPQYIYDMMNEKVKGVGKPDLAKLIASTDDDWLHSADPRPLYAQAWCFVNFIFAYGKVGETYFNKLINGFRGGQPMVKVLPMQERVALASQWNGYLKTVIVPHCEYCAPYEELMKAGEKEEAKKLLAEGLVKYPENTSLLFYKAANMAAGGDAKGAFEIAKNLDKQFPRHPQLSRLLGKLANDTGDKMNAQKWLKKALTENYRDEEVRKLLGAK